MTSPSPTIDDLPATTDRRTAQVVLRGFEKVDVVADTIESGVGPPVVFLHGLVGLNDHWDRVVRQGDQTFRSTMLQLPLLGLKGEDCSIQGATELTIHFLADHFRHPAVVVGNSFGGHVALKIALERPDLVRALVLAGSSGLIERSMVREVQIRPSREWLVNKIGELFFDRSKMNPADVDRAHSELSHRGHARGMVKLTRSARRNHLGDDIHRITAPTLLIWGRQDIVTPPEAALELERKIKGAKLVWFERCGHAPMIESPDEFSLTLQEFVRDLPA